MDITLIPFGLRIHDENFVDVHDVPKGKACGCICPSCRTPLIARKGDRKTWHFAHASRGVYEHTETKCEYSLYVSIRMMARQIIGNELTITLPRYTETLQLRDDKTGRIFTSHLEVPVKEQIHLTDIQVEAALDEHQVDLIGQVSGFPFAIYLTHPGREVPQELSRPEKRECGIIAIDLTRIAAQIVAGKSQDISYQTILQQALCQNTDIKRWIYHPRYSACHEQATRELEQKCLQWQQNHRTYSRAISSGSHSAKTYQTFGNQQSQNSSRKLSNTKSYDNGLYVSGGRKRIELELSSPDVSKNAPRRAQFQCQLCKQTWQGYEHRDMHCDPCNSHLYTTVLRYLDE